MNEIKEITQQSGDGGVNIIGSQNVLNLYKQPIKYDLLSRLCKDLIKINMELSEDMNVTELPVELLEKIEYNNILIHKELYEDLGMYLSDISEIVEKSLGNKSISLIRIIKTIYYEILASNSEYNGDQILFEIENRLLEHTNLTDSNEYLNEDIRYCITQIVLYVFEKCQILKKPKKE